MEYNFSDYEKLIHHTCRRFVTRYGGEYDELVSSAFESYALCTEQYNESKGTKFSTWLVHVIWHRLLDDVRRQAIRSSRYSRLPADIPQQTAVNSEHRIDEIVCSLSDDARDVVNLLLDMPSDLECVLQGITHAGTVRATIKRYVAQLNGWKPAKVKEVWDQVAQSLS